MRALFFRSILVFLSFNSVAFSNELEVKITYYWMARYVPVAGEHNFPLYDTSKNLLARIPKSYAQKIWMEGSGLLPDGRLINLIQGKSLDEASFVLVDKTKFPWGLDSQGDALNPLKTIATDPNLIPTGSKVFIPSFKGLIFNNQVHDGCFLAKDTSHSFAGAQIDIFVGPEEHYPSTENRAKTFGKKIKVKLNTEHC